MKEAPLAQDSSVVVSSVESFDPFRSDFLADPYPFYRAYREDDPIHQSRPGLWWLFRHADCTAMLRDHAHFASDPRRVKRPGEASRPPEAVSPLIKFLSNGVLGLDPPEHTRLRSMIKGTFTLRTVEQLQPAIEVLADNLLDQIQGAGRMDLIADLSHPLAVGVIAELLGVPAADCELVRHWAAAITAAIDIKKDDEDRARLIRMGTEAAQEISAYFQEMAEERRRQPRADLLTAMLGAEKDGDRMNDDELASMCGQLLLAGYETSTHFLGNAVIALFRFPEQMKLLRQSPDLLVPAVDELLRYDTPLQVAGRIACEDIDFLGHRIEFGSVVSAVLGSANHDPEVFADPDRVDLTRGGRHHVTFGQGVHYCVGGPLARVEAQAAVAALLRRMPSLAPVSDRVEWGDRIWMRGPRTLPMTF
jgi:cytochrome P450